jgi:uncharacterized membrane protein
MAIDVRTETIIRRPVTVVAEYTADPSHAPEWYRNIRKVEWRTEPPVRVGSRLAFEATFMGRTLSYTYEVAELVPGKRMVLRTTEGPFPMETTYTWEAVGQDTRMTLGNRGGGSGPAAAVMQPLMAAMVRRATRADLARLKARLENEPGGG